MTHKFDTEIAKEVGLLGAVLYDNIEWWCMKNKSSNINKEDGYYWTYNSNRGWSELFDYASVNQIKLALKKLENSGLIVSGTYNKVAYDRTKWYRLKNLIHQTEKSNEIDRKVQPIPSNKPSNKPDIEEIAKYIADKSLNVDANKFFNYFETSGWVDSKGNKVKNWKQKILTWDNYAKPKEVKRMVRFG